jgi:hypothetical protein
MKIVKALPRLYHQNFNRFPSYPLQQNWMHFLQGSTIKFQCVSKVLSFDPSHVYEATFVDSNKIDEIVQINL